MRPQRSGVPESTHTYSSWRLLSASPSGLGRARVIGIQLVLQPEWGSCPEPGTDARTNRIHYQEFLFMLYITDHASLEQTFNHRIAVHKVSCVAIETYAINIFVKNASCNKK
jgi:hypothetical protein